MRFLVVVLLLFVSIACNTSNDQEKIKTFIAEWSTTIASKDIAAARKFFAGDFVIPKVLFEVPDGISFTLNTDSMRVENGAGDSLSILVPYHVTTTSGLEETSTITLSLIRVADGQYSIFDMSPELTLKIKDFAMALEQQNITPEVALRDSLLLATFTRLQTKYDSVVYYADMNEGKLFYVVTGKWVNPYPYEPSEQKNGGDYKMGVVTADNRIIVPVEYDKIYNPNGSFAGMIEVEKDGKRGLYTVEGKVFLPAEYDGIFPVAIPEVFAQVKKDGKYGWISNAGTASFDVSSHPNKDLFRSPLTSKLVSDWNFNYPGEIIVLVPPPLDDYDQGLIIYPSYLVDLGITPIANRGIANAESQWGMGTEENTIRVERVESVADKFYSLVAFFLDAGTDARNYHTEKNDVFVVDQDGAVVSTLPNLTIREMSQDPCGEEINYKSIEPGFYETYSGRGVYKYFKVNANGEIEELKTPRQYNFTKYVKINETYFAGCRWEHIDFGYQKEDAPNVILSSGLSYEDLDIMRNEIFAEYGFIFKSEKWKTYFESKDWYKPQYENVDQLMTETDKYNVNFIREYQQNHKDQRIKRDSILVLWAG